MVFEFAPGGHATGVLLAEAPSGPSSDLAVATGIATPSRQRLDPPRVSTACAWEEG